MILFRLLWRNFSDRHLCRKMGEVLLILGLGWAILAPSETLAYTPGVEVRNLGLSRQGERTVLTIILNRAANPQVAPFTGSGRAQLIVEFPQARAGKLPARLAGDDVLVKHVRVESSSTGVKIILEMFPDQPYLFTREIRPLKGGMAIVRLGLRSDPTAVRAQEPRAPGALEPQAPAAPEVPEPQEPLKERPSEPAPGAGAAPPYTPVAPTGTFEELYQLMPKARGLLEFLRRDGWTIAEAQSYDRPGQRYSRGFTLNNRLYPELAVRIAHLPPNAPAAPTINLIDLSMGNLQGEVANKYREMRQWDFSRIKGKYEDIGDFFDDALKPLRVDIRKQCQDLALRYSPTLTNFLRQAAPRNPQVADQAITEIRKKVSPRFEGVQYTLSEDPLIILNLVDFFYLRVYYLGN